MTSPDIDNRRILLIGDIEQAFADAEAVKTLQYLACANILDGIEAAAGEKFRGIGIIMSGTSAGLGSALKALRDVCGAARIILLARMHEEPAAMRLVGATSNGTGAADDYLICPIRFSHFLSCISYPAGRSISASREPIRIVRAGVLDAGTASRIKELEKLAAEDDLTGLKNRRYIREFCRQIIERARRANERVTLLVFDIDNFKHYNDVYGHAAGDEILRGAAVLMGRCCRGHDVVGRIGGDEFAVIFWDMPHRRPAETERRSPTTDHPKEVLSIANRFRDELKRAELSLLGPEGKGVLTISGGLASFPDDGGTAQSLFSQADKALLEAKRSGKNRIYLVGKPENNIGELRD